jgi:hypothetical protein
MIWRIENSQPVATTTANTGNANLALDIKLPVLRKIETSNNSAAAPTRGIGAGARSITSYLDVVKDFYWTYSKPESREEVPSIFLRERRLKVNALVSQLKYSLGFAAAEANAAVQVAAKTALDLGFNPNFVGAASTVANEGINAANTVGQEVARLIKQDNNATMAQSAWLQPYRGLYITEPTEWEFLFPYFEDRLEAQTNQFSSEGVTNALGGILQTAANIPTEIAEIAGSIRNPTQITYIERAKFFNYPTDGDEISFSFPLINTGAVSYNDVINNWQLIFLLLYNNKPGRLSPTQIEQPVIYEVEIPGTKFYPFCYISTIDIKFQGSRRELPITLPYNEQQPGFNSAGAAVTVDNQSSFKTINAIIPDAYLVTITLKSMLGNTKNFMYHLIDRGDRTRVGTR